MGMVRISAFGFILGNLAFAQDVGIPTDLSAWFTSTAALAAVVASLIAFLRKHVVKRLDGVFVVVASLLLGVTLAFIGYRLGYLGHDWFIFGLGAGLMASGGVDLVRNVTSKNGQSNNTSADFDRARLR